MVMSSLDNVAQQFASLVPEGESQTIVRDNVGKSNVLVYHNSGAFLKYATQ